MNAYGFPVFSTLIVSSPKRTRPNKQIIITTYKIF